MVGVDDELAVRPLGIFVSADQKLQGELFEDVIVGGLKFVIGQSSRGRRWFADVGTSSSSASWVSKDSMVGSLQDVKVFNILGTQKMLVLKKSFALLTTLRILVKESIYRNHAKHDVAEQHRSEALEEVVHFVHDASQSLCLMRLV